MELAQIHAVAPRPQVLPPEWFAQVNYTLSVVLPRHHLMMLSESVMVVVVPDADEDAESSARGLRAGLNAATHHLGLTWSTTVVEPFSDEHVDLEMTSNLDQLCEMDLLATFSPWGAQYADVTLSAAMDLYDSGVVLSRYAQMVGCLVGWGIQSLRVDINTYDLDDDTDLGDDADVDGSVVDQIGDADVSELQLDDIIDGLDDVVDGLDDGWLEVQAIFTGQDPAADSSRAAGESDELDMPFSPNDLVQWVEDVCEPAEWQLMAPSVAEALLGGGLGDIFEDGERIDSALLFDTLRAFAAAAITRGESSQNPVSIWSSLNEFFTGEDPEDRMFQSFADRLLKGVIDLQEALDAANEDIDIDSELDTDSEDAHGPGREDRKAPENATRSATSVHLPRREQEPGHRNGEQSPVSEKFTFDVDLAGYVSSDSRELVVTLAELLDAVEELITSGADPHTFNWAVLLPQLHQDLQELVEAEVVANPVDRFRLYHAVSETAMLNRFRSIIDGLSQLQFSSR